MVGTRSYGEACAAAHALDLIGERWALLLVRELLFGPKRFADLRTGLPQAGPNRITQRLRELEELGVVRRRKLPPPAASWVYELTDWGRELEPVILHLGRWGVRSPWRDEDGPVSPDSAMLALRMGVDPVAAAGLTAVFEVRFGEHRFGVQLKNGEVTVDRDPVGDPDATVDSDPVTFTSVLSRRVSLAAARRSGELNVAGDVDAVRALFAAIPSPPLAPKPGSL